MLRECEKKAVPYVFTAHEDLFPPQKLLILQWLDSDDVGDKQY